MSPIPTIRQLAKLAGVSRTTVSMALRNHPRISEKTRSRILKFAAKHGYTPDPLVSTLMNQLRTSRKQRSVEKLAYLTFWQNGAEKWRSNLNELQYFEGACDRAKQLGYEIEHFWAKEPGMNSARMSKILYSRGIRGVVLGPLPRHLGHVSLNWQYFACAAISLTILRPELHRATHGYHQGMTLVLRTLKRRGYKRIGFANSALYDRRVEHGWLSGFLTYQHMIPAKQHVPPLLVDGWIQSRFWRWLQEQGPGVQPGKDWRKNEFAKWLDRYRPDAIVSNTDHAYVFSRELGYRIPEDIGYAQLHRLSDDDPWAGIDRLPHRIAAAAVDLVAGQLQSNEFGLPEHPKRVITECVWRDGPSVRNAPVVELPPARSAKA